MVDSQLLNCGWPWALLQLATLAEESSCQRAAARCAFSEPEPGAAQLLEQRLPGAEGVESAGLKIADKQLHNIMIAMARHPSRALSVSAFSFIIADLRADCRLTEQRARANLISMCRWSACRTLQSGGRQW